jgi:hypothetical protein
LGITIAFLNRCAKPVVCRNSILSHTDVSTESGPVLKQGLAAAILEHLVQKQQEKVRDGVYVSDCHTPFYVTAGFSRCLCSFGSRSTTTNIRPAHTRASFVADQTQYT